MVPSTREEAIEFLMKSINYERQVPKAAPDATFKLQTMRWLSNYFGNPHLSYPVIHVAGTKGKGSTANMIARILGESGAKVGLYTSPHLHHLEERLVINGESIDEERLVSIVQRLYQAVDALQVQIGEGHYSGNLPTFFELLTMAAWLHFASQNVDVAVVEVGLGGRLDSTNICQARLGVITSISHDHMQQLGNQLSEIAAEKAGIIKPGMTVVSGVQTPEAADVIHHRAREVGARLIVIDEDFRLVPSGGKSDSLEDQTYEFQWLPFSPTPDKMRESISGLKVGLEGQHQVGNAALATAAAVLCREHGLPVTLSSIRNGLLHARPAGRIEVIPGKVPLVVDVAHNPAAIQALVKTLEARKETYQQIRVVLSVSEDKDAEKILQPLLGFADVLVLTAFQENPRALAPQELLQRAQLQREQLSSGRALDMKVLPDPQAVFEWLEATADARDLTVVTGSTFLVSEMRAELTTWNLIRKTSESLASHPLK
jgi:dihydrofolate synthase/folylpolyglutamate synthase